jgi:DNA-binding CsgD family transcriptional regulator
VRRRGRPRVGRFRESRLTKANELTEREHEVPSCLGQGLSNAQIGARLHLTESAVKGYVSRVLVKLGCANRTQAGLIAHELDLPRQPHRDQATLVPYQHLPAITGCRPCRRLPGERVHPLAGWAATGW